MRPWWPSQDNFCKAWKDFKHAMKAEVDIDFCIKEHSLDQRARPKPASNKQKLWQDKEKIYLNKPWTGPCPDKTHPLFTISVGSKSPDVASCYYCSKTWIYRDDIDPEDWPND